MSTTRSGNRIIWLFVKFALILLFSGGMGILIISSSMEKFENALKQRSHRETGALKMKGEFHDCRFNLMDALVFARSPQEFDAARARYEAAKNGFMRECDLLLAVKGPTRTNREETSGDFLERIRGTRNEFALFAKTGDTLLAKKLEMLNRSETNAVTNERFDLLVRSEMYAARESLSSMMNALVNDLEGLEPSIGGDAGVVKKEAMIRMALVAVCALLLAGILGIAAAMHYSRWLKMFAEALKRGANGDLNAKVGLFSADKLGELGIDFNTMTDRLSGMIGKISKSTDELSRVSGNLSHTSKQVLDAAQSQTDGISDTSSAITQINASVKGVAQGIDSLSLSAAESSSSIMEMAASIEEVALNVETLTQSVEEVSSSIVEMATSIKQIDTNVVNLTDEFATTASSIMEMDGSINQVEKSAMDTAAISEEVRRDAETGKEAVAAAIAGMREIKRSAGITYEAINTLSKRAEDIGAILSVIDEVAEQTNLLALNAAIIAAQAGEHGKGFAVVADEIKELADRTSSSTREISQVIRGVQDETRRAVEAITLAEKSIADGELLSQKSGEALNKIVAGVNSATEQVEGIARATLEQAKGSQMIREAIEKVLEMVGQIAIATREQGMGGELIMTAVERMKGLTAQVRVSTREQSKVGNFIAKSTENITEMIHQIKRACDEQSRGSEQIVVAVEDIKQSNTVNLDATMVMSNAVMNLSRQIEILKKEMADFKI